jgi:hypothetical protein
MNYRLSANWEISQDDYRGSRNLSNDITPLKQEKGICLALGPEQHYRFLWL